MSDDSLVAARGIAKLIALMVAGGDVGDAMTRIQRESVTDLEAMTAMAAVDATVANAATANVAQAHEHGACWQTGRSCSVPSSRDPRMTDTTLRAHATAMPRRVANASDSNKLLLAPTEQLPLFADGPGEGVHRRVDENSDA